MEPIVQTVTQEMINAYEEILGVGNPLHFDEEYARQTPFGGIIAHGMMSLAYLSEMMGRAFGDGWYSGGQLDTTFVLPVRPGDTIKAWGRIAGQKRVNEETCVVCDVYCENQRGEEVLTGIALAMLPESTADSPRIVL